MPEALIETAIGLFFVFILMSMISSQLVEWIASYRRWRAKDLEKTIRIMLGDPALQRKIDENALALTERFYEHPLITSLGRPGSKPSYIPAGKFALALFDVIVTAGTEVSTIGQARVGLEQVKNHLLASLPSTAEAELISLINQIQKLIDEAKASGPNPETIAALPLPPLLHAELNGFLNRYSIPPSTLNALIKPLMTDSDLQLNQVMTGVIQLAKTRPRLSQLLASLFSGLDLSLAEGQSRLVAARHSVEEWYDEAMERASGWYKRHTQVWLAFVGFLLALVLNVDTLGISAALWQDPTLRQNVVGQVQNYQLVETDDGTTVLNVEDAAQRIRELNEILVRNLSLPVGWHTELYTLQEGESCAWLPQRTGDVWGIPREAACIKILEASPGLSSGPLTKLLGLLLTAVAISQGAPFWFDLLSKLGNLRSSGAVPATSQEKRKEMVEQKG